MNISIDTQLNFQSKANPIKPFVIKTKRGRLNVAEVTPRDLKREGFIENLTKFFCKNFASSTNDPAWKIFTKHNSLNYGEDLKNFVRYYASKIKLSNEDMTLLLAKDKRNKIQGACLSYGYDKIPGVKNKVCYVDSIAINPSYRGFKIGNALMKKTIESAQNKFSDIFLAGDKISSEFYEKLGFKPLDKNDEAQKTVIDYVSKSRSDYPNYIELYTKSLRDFSERWYNVCANKIK